MAVIVACLFMNGIIPDTNGSATHQPKTEGGFMIFVILAVILIVSLVMLIMKRNGAKVSFVKFDYYMRKSKLGFFLEFVFLLAVVFGCIGMLITLFAALFGETWIWFAWSAGGTFSALVMTYFIRITNNIYSLLLEKKQLTQPEKSENHTDIV